MAYDMVIRTTVTAAGKNFNASYTVSSEAGEVRELSLSAAKAGTLSTRTDNDAGVLTLSSGHGITTGQIIDLYWSGAYRASITVGTVSTATLVPISGGFGSALPAAATAITCMVQEVNDCNVDVNDLVGACAYCAEPALFIFYDTNTDPMFTLYLQDGQTAWYWDGGTSNPFDDVYASTDIATVRMTHSDSSASQTTRFSLSFN